MYMADNKKSVNNGKPVFLDDEVHQVVVEASKLERRSIKQFSNFILERESKKIIKAKNGKANS